MKTAMQELIEKFQEYNKPKTKGLVRISISLDNVIEFCEELLEKEKEQVINAHENGQSEFDSLHYRDKNVTLSNNYYNQTYNQNK